MALPPPSSTSIVSPWPSAAAVRGVLSAALLLGVSPGVLPLRATPLPEEWPLVVPPPAAVSPPASAPASAVALPQAGSPQAGSADPAASPIARPVAVPGSVAVADLSAGLAAAPLLASSGSWLYPLTLEPQEQDPWGWRWSEARQRWRMHTGVDLLVPEGSPVLAAQEGLVLLAEEVSGYGLTVLLAHADGWQTLYGHLSTMAVQPGARVLRGQRLGLVGATGNASAPHLHLELRRREGDVLLAHDPTPLLAAPRPAAALAALP